MFKVCTLMRFPYLDYGLILSWATMIYLISMVFPSVGFGGWGTEKLEGRFVGSFI